MPKGKSKVVYPELYPAVSDAAKEVDRSLAPQSAPHRRGGIHRIKDSDRTGTHWDYKGYQELVFVAKERKLFRKDMPKTDIIHLLAADDRERELAIKRANEKAYTRRKKLEEKKKREIEEALKKEEERQKEKEERLAIKEQMRMLGDDMMSWLEEEPVDDNVRFEGESARDNVGHGHVVSDEADDYESTTTTTTAPSSLSLIAPAPKLRIFEWPYPEAPPESPPVSPISLSGRVADDAPPEPPLRKLPYAAMNVVTTKSRETLELPGRNMPEEVGPDFVPKLSEHTKDCARNGVILESLGNAIIERGVDWAARTQVQWWNGRMYLHLPPRQTKVDLAEVYGKWKKEKPNKARQNHKRGGGIAKAEPKQKAQAQLKKRTEKMLDVYAASEYRPPICFVPSYLDFPLLDDDEEVAKSPYNLFYIRFKNMRLPHYFFWADPEEWDDPTVPNPAWAAAEANRIVQPMGLGSLGNVNEAEMVMVKREPVPHKFSPTAKPPNGSKYKVTLWAIEKALYLHGWAKTMHNLREKWLKQGKGGRWTRLISRLVIAFPGGNLPTSPPVGPTMPNTKSLAEKFAAISVPSPQRPVEPIYGDEPWTRDDAAYWIPVAVSELKGEADIQTELLRKSSLTELEETQALHRRRSEIFAWMDNLSSPVTPPPVSVPHSPLPAFRAAEREAWEERFLEQVEGETALATTIECMPIAQLKGHLFNMINERRRSSLLLSRCAFCLTLLEGLSVQEWRAHFETHAESANELCPFCGMPWVGWSNHLRAAHIFHHDVDEGALHITRRRSSSVSSGFGALSAIPRTKQGRTAKGRESTPRRGVRKLSKVHFSPVTVERRIAYNDVANDDHNMNVDEISTATVSPKRSNLRSHTKTAKRSRKPSPASTKRKRATKSTARAKADDADLSWDPRRYSSGSGSEHVLSPPLHKRNAHPPEHPDAKWDPRRISKSSAESLEYKAVSRRSRRTTRNRRNVASKALERRSSDPVNKERATDPSGRNELPSPVSSLASSVAMLKRKRVSDSRESPAGRRKSKISRQVTHNALSRLAPLNMQHQVHRGSTDSNVSSASDVRRQADVEWPDEDLIRKATSKRTSTPSGLSKSFTSPPPSTEKKRNAAALDPPTAKSPASASSKRRKTSNASSKESHGSNPFSSDYIPFVNDNLLEDLTSDVLTGNPFAAVPEKPKSKTTRAKARARKTPSSIKTAPETRHNAAAAGLKTRRATKTTTILGRSHVEPLPVAPAGRYSQPRSRSTASGSINDLFKPPTSASPTTISPKSTPPKRTRSISLKPSTSPSSAPPDPTRGRRSSAPTPSPSLASRPTTFHTSVVQTKSKATESKAKASPRPIDVADTKRKASYDVPFSDVHAIVPPNTPADGLVKARRSSKVAVETVGGPALDAGQLSDRIGTVKTTRRGLVRELPVGVERSVVGKGKARGRSVAMKREKEKEKERSGGLGRERAAVGTGPGAGAGDKEPVVRKRVVKKGVKVTRPARVRKVGAKR